MKRTTIVILACLAFFAVAGAALAQVPKPDRYSNPLNLDPEGIPYDSKYWQSRPDTNVISLIRRPELTEDQFILRISDPYGVSGCVDVKNYSTFTEFTDGVLEVNIGPTTVDMRDQPQFAHLQCDLRTKTPMAEIIINRQDLMKNGVKKFRLRNMWSTNNYNVTLRDNRVSILPDIAEAAIPQRFKPQPIPGRKTPLVYWFYPLGTVLLWVPGEDDTKQMQDNIRKFAAEQGLVPLEKIYLDFKSPRTEGKYQYFVDTEGKFAKNPYEDMKNGMPVGTVKGEKRVYGLEKDEYKPYDITVYAKIPGMYD